MINRQRAQNDYTFIDFYLNAAQTVNYTKYFSAGKLD